VIFGKTLFGEDELPKDGDLKNFKVGKVSRVCNTVGFGSESESE
jgi:hypothetical protein